MNPIDKCNIYDYFYLEPYVVETTTAAGPATAAATAADKKEHAATAPKRNLIQSVTDVAYNMMSGLVFSRQPQSTNTAASANTASTASTAASAATAANKKEKSASIPNIRTVMQTAKNVTGCFIDVKKPASLDPNVKEIIMAIVNKLNATPNFTESDFKNLRSYLNFGGSVNTIISFKIRQKNSKIIDAEATLLEMVVGRIIQAKSRIKEINEAISQSEQKYKDIKQVKSQRILGPIYSSPGLPPEDLNNIPPENVTIFSSHFIGSGTQANNLVAAMVKIKREKIGLEENLKIFNKMLDLLLEGNKIDKPSEDLMRSVVTSYDNELSLKLVSAGGEIPDLSDDNKKACRPVDDISAPLIPKTPNLLRGKTISLPKRFSDPVLYAQTFNANLAIEHLIKENAVNVFTRDKKVKRSIVADAAMKFWPNTIALAHDAALNIFGAFLSKSGLAVLPIASNRLIGDYTWSEEYITEPAEIEGKIMHPLALLPIDMEFFTPEMLPQAEATMQMLLERGGVRQFDQMETRTGKYTFFQAFASFFVDRAWFSDVVSNLIKAGVDCTNLKTTVVKFIKEEFNKKKLTKIQRDRLNDLMEEVEEQEERVAKLANIEVIDTSETAANGSVANAAQPAVENAEAGIESLNSAASSKLDYVD